MASTSTGDITGILHAWGLGEPSALNELIARVEPELRKLAHIYFQREDDDHTLQPTEVVSEVCIRLKRWRKVQWDNRKQFFFWVAQFMRRILIDYAHRRKRDKRGGRVKMLSLTGARDRVDETLVDPALVLDLDTALKKLAKLDSDAARVVELKFFAGLTGDEIAKLLGCSRATVTRHWTAAKMFLARELGDGVEDSLPPG